MNVEEYNEKIIKPMVERFAVAQAAEILFQSSALEDMLFAGYEPPTKWELFKYKIENYKQRCKDIWTILKGGDIHRDCGY